MGVILKRRKADRFARSLLLLQICALLGCGPDPVSRDLLLITIDTLRADHLGAYGYSRPTSPEIDAIAREGALFEVAYAPMGTTCPSHATLFTSRQPLSHGVVRNGLSLVAAEHTLAERLLEHGYQTAAFVSSFPVSKRFGFDQGFEHFDDHFESGTSSWAGDSWAGVDVEGRFDRRGAETTDAVLVWLAAKRDDRPLFVWVHLFDPHAPYVAPEAQQQLFPVEGNGEHADKIAAYDAEVRYADLQVGRIVEAFDAATSRGSLVVITSDHGEGLFDHGWLAHNRYLFEEEVRIPLIFRWRGRIPGGLRSQQPAHLVDLLPTLGTLLEVPVDPAPGSDGLDLSPYLTASQRPAPDLERLLWLQRPYYTVKAPKPLGSPELRTEGFGVRSGRWKYIEAPGVGRRELYDLESDPGERKNLAPGRRRAARGFSRRIAEWRRSQLATASERTDEISPSDVEALRALGYAE